MGSTSATYSSNSPVATVKQDTDLSESRSTGSQRGRSPAPKTSAHLAPKSPSKRYRSPSEAGPSRKHNSNPVKPQTLRNDCLGTLVQSLCEKLDSASSWEEFVRHVRGRSYLLAKSRPQNRQPPGYSSPTRMEGQRCASAHFIRPLDRRGTRLLHRLLVASSSRDVTWSDRMSYGHEYRIINYRGRSTFLTF